MGALNADPFIKKIRTIPTKHDCLVVRYINLKKSIAAGLMDGSLCLYNAKNHKLEITLSDSDTANVNNAVTGFGYSSAYNNLLVSTYSGGYLKFWDYFTGKCLHTENEKRQTYGAVYHPKRPKIFTYGDDGKIFLYDVETQKKEFVYQKSNQETLDGHVSKVFAFRFNPNNSNEFLTGGWDSTLYFWDVRCANAIRHISDIFMGGEGILINSKGTELITCEWKMEDPIKQWCYKTGRLMEVIQPDMDQCHLYCGFYINNKTIATGGSDENMFRVISLTAGSTLSYIKNLPKGIYSMDKMDEGKRGASMTAPKIDEFADLPMILFSAGKCLYEVRYR